MVMYIHAFSIPHVLCKLVWLLLLLVHGTQCIN